MKQITILIDGEAYEAVKGEDECPCGHCDLHELCEKLSMQAIPCLLGMDKVEDLHVVYFEKIRVKDSLYFKRSPEKCISPLDTYVLSLSYAGYFDNRVVKGRDRALELYEDYKGLYPNIDVELCTIEDYLTRKNNNKKIMDYEST